MPEIPPTPADPTTTSPTPRPDLPPEARAVLAAIKGVLEAKFPKDSLRDIAAQLIFGKLRDGINETGAIDPSAQYYWTRSTLLKAMHEKRKVFADRSLQRNLDRLRIGVEKYGDGPFTVEGYTFTVRFHGPAAADHRGGESALIYMRPVVTTIRQPAPARGVPRQQERARIRPTVHPERQGQIPASAEPHRKPDQVAPYRAGRFEGALEIYRLTNLQWQFMVRGKSVQRRFRDSDIQWHWVVQTPLGVRRETTPVPVLLHEFSTPPVAGTWTVTVLPAEVHSLEGQLDRVGANEVVLVDRETGARLTQPSSDLTVYYETDLGTYRFRVRDGCAYDVLHPPAFDPRGVYSFPAPGNLPAIGVARDPGDTRHLVFVLVPDERETVDGGVSFAFGDGSVEHGAPPLSTEARLALPPPYQCRPIAGTDHRYDRPGDYEVVAYMMTSGRLEEVARINVTVP